VRPLKSAARPAGRRAGWTTAVEDTLAFPVVLQPIDERAAAFRAAIAAAPSPDTRVPTCPEWSVRELAQHPLTTR
jgi:hypothetical protein